MTDATVDQVRRYILDGSDDDLRRLLSLSESLLVSASGRNQPVFAGSDRFVAGGGHAPFSSLPPDRCLVRADRRAGQGSRSRSDAARRP